MTGQQGRARVSKDARASLCVHVRHARASLLKKSITYECLGCPKAHVSSHDNVQGPKAHVSSHENVQGSKVHTQCSQPPNDIYIAT